MPMPREFQHACEDFEAILGEVGARGDLATRNQAWTTLDAVLRVFRRRLTVAEAIGFADVLPPLARAMFVADWNLAEAPRPFASREAMTEEVRAVRPHHNFAPETAIMDVATALRRRVDPLRFAAVVGALPAGAVDYWRPAEDDAA